LGFVGLDGKGMTRAMENDQLTADWLDHNSFGRICRQAITHQPLLNDRIGHFFQRHNSTLKGDSTSNHSFTLNDLVHLGADQFGVCTDDYLNSFATNHRLPHDLQFFEFVDVYLAGVNHRPPQASDAPLNLDDVFGPSQGFQELLCLFAHSLISFISMDRAPEYQK
jgi:hypothetical protein